MFGLGRLTKAAHVQNLASAKAHHGAHLRPPVPPVRTDGSSVVLAPSFDGDWPLADFVQDMVHNGASWDAVIWVLRLADELLTPAPPSADASADAVTEADAAALERLRIRRERDAAYKREKRRQAREMRSRVQRTGVTGNVTSLTTSVDAA